MSIVVVAPAFLRRAFRPLANAGLLLLLLAPLLILGAGCSALPAVPARTTGGAAAGTEGRRLLLACLEAHGGARGYAALRDVNVRYDSQWQPFVNGLQPKLVDAGFRGGSEERYLRAAGIGGGSVVAQHHRGASGEKHVFRRATGSGPRSIAVSFNGQPATDPEATAAAALVADAYALFLFGPDFIVRRGGPVERLPEATSVNGRPCDQVLAILRPGLGLSAEDRVILAIDRQDRTLRRVQFTLEGLESTRGADVHVDLGGQTRRAGVLFPTEFYERIDRPGGDRGPPLADTGSGREPGLHRGRSRRPAVPRPGGCARGADLGNWRELARRLGARIRRAAAQRDFLRGLRSLGKRGLHTAQAQLQAANLFALGFHLLEQLPVATRAGPNVHKQIRCRAEKQDAEDFEEQEHRTGDWRAFLLSANDARRPRRRGRCRGVAAP